MPAINDFIATTIISELSGVSMSSLLYWKVDNLGDDDAIEVNLGKLATAYAAVTTDITITSWAVTCMVYFNHTQTEPKVVHPVTIAGTAAGDSHPQSQALRFNRWGVHIPDSKVRHGAHYLSGVPESFSTVGRINDAAEFNALENLLSDTLVLADDGWTLLPQLFITPDWKNFPTVHAFVLASQCQVNATYAVLRSRKTKLCGTV
jgi:hypothetical protein